MWVILVSIWLPLLWVSTFTILLLLLLFAAVVIITEYLSAKVARCGRTWIVFLYGAIFSLLTFVCVNKIGCNWHWLLKQLEDSVYPVGLFVRCSLEVVKINYRATLWNTCWNDYTMCVRNDWVWMDWLRRVEWESAITRTAFITESLSSFSTATPKALSLSRNRDSRFANHATRPVYRRSQEWLTRKTQERNFKRIAHITYIHQPDPNRLPPALSTPHIPYMCNRFVSGLCVKFFRIACSCKNHKINGVLCINT